MRHHTKASCLLSVLCAFGIVHVVSGSNSAAASSTTDTPLVSAVYSEPTERYPHGVLGDKIEYGALVLTYDDGHRTMLRLPEERVFEDTNPRLVDLDGDGLLDVVVVESHQSQGARLAIYNGDGLVTATPYIGQRFRWLSPVAVADLDGDGQIEIAYIDRPHLSNILRIWRYSGGSLTQIATADGVTNHRIGERDIAGGLRNCGAGAEMIVARADWQRLIALTFDGTTLTARDIGAHVDRSSFAKAMQCE